MKIFILILMPLILFSCASPPQKKRQQRNYSKQTLDTFEEIERGKAIERYRMMRARDWKSYTKKKRSIRRSRRKIPLKVYGQKKSGPTRRPTPPPAPTPAPLLSQEKRESINTEAEQLSSYFCMKNRKSSKFSDENDCRAYADNTVEACREKINHRITDRTLIRCVKKELHLQ